jgi:hypothetical protein
MAAVDEPISDAVGVPPAPRWVAALFAVLGAATIPWTAYLAVSLPDRARTHNYRVAWVGFDILLVVVLLLTAYVAWRGRRLVGLLAASAATMLIVDAWFDVTTSNRSEVFGALLSAAFVELPLAAVCGWIAMHVDQVVERRLRQLARRAAHLPATSPAGATARAGVRAARAGTIAAEAGGRATQAGTRAAEQTISDADDARGDIPYGRRSAESLWSRRRKRDP